MGEKLSNSVNLLPHQISHVEKLEKILWNSFAALDYSPTGSGKTYTALKIAQNLHSKILVISSSSIISEWKKLSKEYHVEVIDIISYQKCSRGFERDISYDILNPKKIETPLYKELTSHLSEGVLVILDEISFLKNVNCSRFKFIRELLIKAYQIAYDPNPDPKNRRCRILSLSATPPTSPDEIYSLLVLLGIIQEKTLLDNISLVREKAKALDSEEFEKIEKELQYSEDKQMSSPLAKELSSKFYQRIFKNFYCSSMPPLQVPISVNFRKCFYAFPKENLNNIRRNLNLIKQEFRMDLSSVDPIEDEEDEEDERKKSKINLSYLTRALREIEKEKTSVLIRIASEELESNLQKKIIIFLHYNDNLEKVLYGLCDYPLEIISGKHSPEKRSKIIEKFNEPNSEIRLLLIILNSGAIGINLHDLDGNFPRIALICPSFLKVDITQASGRIYRENVKSEVDVRLIYSKSIKEEDLIYKKISERKEEDWSFQNYKEMIEEIDDY